MPRPFARLLLLAACLCAALILPAGAARAALHDPDTAIAGSAGASSHVTAWDGEHGQWRVFWLESTGAIETQAIAADGSLDGTPTTVLATPTSDVARYELDVAFDSTTYQYLVVWMQTDADHRDGSIQGMRVGAGGGPIGVGSQRIDDFSMQVPHPAVAYNPISQRFTVA